jgi:hypothetical protein
MKPFVSAGAPPHNTSTPTLCQETPSDCVFLQFGGYCEIVGGIVPEKPSDEVMSRGDLAGRHYRIGQFKADFLRYARFAGVPPRATRSPVRRRSLLRFDLGAAGKNLASRPKRSFPFGLVMQIVNCLFSVFANRISDEIFASCVRIGRTQRARS